MAREYRNFTREIKLGKNEKQNVSFFIDAYSAEILITSISKSLNSDFIELKSK